MREKIDWRLVVLLTVVGAIATLLGVRLASSVDDALSGLLIEVGVGVGLVGAIFLLERRMVRTVTKAAAEIQVETGRLREQTDQLQERIVRLEDLDRAQEEEVARRQEAVADAATRARSGDLSAAAIHDLLADAKANNWLRGASFRVRGVGLGNSVVAGQAAFSYSLMSPSHRVVLSAVTLAGIDGGGSCAASGGRC